MEIVPAVTYTCCHVFVGSIARGELFSVKNLCNDLVSSFSAGNPCGLLISHRTVVTLQRRDVLIVLLK